MELPESQAAALAGLGLASTGPLTERYVRMGVEEAAGIVRSWWGVDGPIERLATEKDDSFITDEVVIKVAGPSERLEDLELETALMSHVSASGCDVAVPRTLEAADGRQIVAVTDRAGQERLVRVISVIPGDRFDPAIATAIQRGRLGEVLARLEVGCAGFSHPADARVSAWDMLQLPHLAPLTSCIADADGRALVERALAAFTETVLPHSAELPVQMVHNDFNAANILVDPHDPTEVRGIIDFGDAVRTAVAVDLATALSYQLPGTRAQITGRELFAPARELLHGYQRVKSLSELELALLGELVRGRLVARALISGYRAQLFPENAAYVLRNTGPVMMLLGELDRFGRDELAEVFA